MNVPQLRFKGFEGEWGIYRLDEFFEFIDGDRGPNYPNEKDFKNEGYCVFLNAHNISENGLTFNHINWLTEEKHKKLRKGTVERGDLILTSRGSKLGKLALYDEKVPYEIMRINSAMLLIRKIRSELDSHYSISLFKESLLPRFINANKVGSAQPHITVKDIKRLKFSMPQDINEQKRIAHLFRLLNQRIIKQQEKIEKLEQFKKGMMQKIFSQDLRFKDEDGGEFPEWEEKKLGQVLKIKHGRDQKKIELPDGKFPILATGGVIGSTDTFIYDQESVLIGRKGTIDRPIFMDTPFWTVDTLFYSEIKENSFSKFVFYIFQSINWKMYNEASGVPSLSAKTIEAIKIMTPNYKEQKIIADYLSIIDKKIEKEKEKLLVLEEQKKGFMQVMFV